MDMNLKGIMQTLGAKPGQVVSNPYVRAFAPQPTIKEGDGEDHEVSMANNSIDTIIKMATELKAKMGEDEKQIPAWIQDHIAKAENLISQASGNYHEYGDSNESVNEAVDFKDGKYRFYSKDGVGYLTYDGKELSSGDFDWEDGSNSYWMYHSSWGGQKAFDTGKDVIAYFKKNKIVKESVNEGKKAFKINPPIGKAKYSISAHDGIAKHKDGSPFWDILIFKNKADLERRANYFRGEKYIEESVNESAEILKPGTKVKLRGGKTGKVVRYDGKTPGSPFYIVDIGQYYSIEVPADEIKTESVNTSLRLTKLK